MLTCGRLAVLAICAVIVSGCTMPDPEAGFAHIGPYIGGGYTHSLEDFDGLGAGVKADDSHGLNLKFGYRGSEYAAIEADYSDLFGYDLNTTSPSEIEGYVGTVNLKLFPTATLSFNRLQPYVFGGIGYVALDAANYDTALATRYGIGADLYLTQTTLFYAEFGAVNPGNQGSTDNLHDFDSVNLNFGVQFRFGE
ncbi:MAG: outer membrane beta-barrel protein [Planctomycetota bacterium]